MDYNTKNNGMQINSITMHHRIGTAVVFIIHNVIIFLASNLLTKTLKEQLRTYIEEITAISTANINSNWFHQVAYHCVTKKK